MLNQSIYHTYKRLITLRTHRIAAMPIAILMPHSACNCRCVMCDIWKDNKNLKQLTPDDIAGLLSSFKKLGTKQVVMSGGESLLNIKFFQLCDILKEQDIQIILLSTGISLKKYANEIVEKVDQVIVSLDGDDMLHDAIRSIPGAFRKMKEGIAALRAIKEDYKITCRTVIHQLNFRAWDRIIDSAKEISIDQISFLPADVSSQAFNRETIWDQDRQAEVMVRREDLEALKSIILQLQERYRSDFENRFIAESPEKLMRIHGYYRALYGLQDFPGKRCNAPWVSVVIEADGNVRPCFFHGVSGNIREESLDNILNTKTAISFRKKLNMDEDVTCKQCVCYLNLPAHINPAML